MKRGRSRYLDTEFLIRLIDDYQLDLDAGEVLADLCFSLPCSTRSTAPINSLIYAALCQIAEKFLAERRDAMIAEIREYEPNYEPRDDSFEYEKFVNCLDSSVWFTDMGFQLDFDVWRDGRI